jgi:hypothetical protein
MVLLMILIWYLLNLTLNRLSVKVLPISVKKTDKELTLNAEDVEELLSINRKNNVLHADSPLPPWEDVKLSYNHCFKYQFIYYYIMHIIIIICKL